MKIYAKGKNIPTFAFGKLFTQGESMADTITFYIERFYEGKDMLDFSFHIKGVTENGAEALQSLFPIENGKYVALNWTVSELYTVYSGELKLEIIAVKGESESDRVVVKYNMPSVYVNASVKGTNEVMPDVAEQLMNEISESVSTGINEIQSVIDNFDLSSVEQRLDNMDEDINVFLARPEVIPLTQEKYDSMGAYKENALYVIIKEVSV